MRLKSHIVAQVCGGLYFRTAHFLLVWYGNCNTNQLTVNYTQNETTSYPQEHKTVVTWKRRFQISFHQLRTSTKQQLKSHVIALCAAASYSIFVAYNKNRTNQISFILSHAIACICTLSQRCAALVQCDNCHNQSQTCHKSHDK